MNQKQMTATMVPAKCQTRSTKSLLAMGLLDDSVIPTRPPRLSTSKIFCGSKLPSSSESQATGSSQSRCHDCLGARTRQRGFEKALKRTREEKCVLVVVVV